MNYYLMPFEVQPDHGFGLMGSFYCTSAEELTKVAHFKTDWYSVFPVNFLRRHCIELFLKSGIILFHKKFKIDFENDSCESDPKVKLMNGSWELMRKIHNVGELYNRLNELIKSQSEYLKKNTKTRWEFDPNFQKWIDKINGYDSVSDYFRYPISRDPNKDKKKSIFHENTMEGIQKEMASGKKIMALFVENSDGEITKIYNQGSDTNDELFVALEKASNELYGFHAAVRAELLGV